MKRVEHTPTPWMLDELHGLYVERQDDGERFCIADCDAGIGPDAEARGKANAALIVKAVNAHDGLVAALQGLLGFVADRALTDNKIVADARIAAARDALAKATREWA